MLACCYCLLTMAHTVRFSGSGLRQRSDLRQLACSWTFPCGIKLPHSWADDLCRGCSDENTLERACSHCIWCITTDLLTITTPPATPAAHAALATKQPPTLKHRCGQLQPWCNVNLEKIPIVWNQTQVELSPGAKHAQDQGMQALKPLSGSKKRTDLLEGE